MGGETRGGGGGAGGGAGGGGRKAPIPLPFFLPPYPLSLSTLATQAKCTRTTYTYLLQRGIT